MNAMKISKHFLLMNLMTLLHFKYEESDEISSRGSYFIDFTTSCSTEFITHKNSSLSIPNFLGIYHFIFIYCSENGCVLEKLTPFII